MEQLKALTKGRARLKANITRSLAWSEDAQHSNATRAEVSSRLKHLDTTWKEFTRFGDEIAMLDEVDGYVDPEHDNIFYEEKYLRADALLSAMFMKLPTTTRSDTTTLRKVSDGANEIVRGFLDMSAGQRFSFAKENALCYNCLNPGHGVRKCKSTFKCRQCKGQHHSLLHLQRTQQAIGTISQTGEDQEDPSAHISTATTSHIAQAEGSAAIVCAQGSANSQQSTGWNRSTLPTAMVNVRNANGDLVACRLLLDTGSELSYISERCIQTLGLARTPSRILVTGISSIKADTTRGCITISIQSRISQDQLVVQAHVLGKITSSLERQAIDASALRVFNDLQLADSQFSTNAPIDILLGSEHVWSVITGRKIYDDKGKLIAISSIFGWVITSLLSSRACSATAFTTTIDIDAYLRRFWELESIQRKAEVQPEDEEVEKHFLATHTRDKQGKYIVELPFKVSETQFADTLQGALQRFKSVERRLAQNHQLRNDYVKFMREYQELGHMREISPSEIPKGRNFYLPHHPVLGRKLRVVFDGSYQDAKGMALNDTLSIGPSIQRDLFAVCLRFRMYKYVFSADIVKMFRQIWGSEKHRDYQRIVWREDPSDPIKHFQLCTVTYGTSCAPFVAVRVLEQLAADHKHEFPNAAKIVLEDFYVDDVLTGANSEDELLRNRDELVQLMSCANLELGKWVSNTKRIKSEDNTDSSQSPVKVLGLHWHPGEDTLSCNVNLSKDPRCTKRQVLSDVSRIFDPLCLLAPIVVQFKILFQILWLLNLNWDDELPSKLANNWLKWRADLDNLHKLQIPRLVKSDKQRIELHGFSDASTKAYSAVVYSRVVNDDGTISVAILAAKTRVAPLKQQSLPRLELCGALLLSQLLQSIKAGLMNNDVTIYAWSDSTIVLSWLSYLPAQLNTFVGNRTSEILETIPKHAWRHVDSKSNPADCASRGLGVSELIDFQLWWKGPSWPRDKEQFLERLNNTHNCTSLSDKRIQDEVKTTCLAAQTNVTTDNPWDKLLNRNSSWLKLIHTLAYVLRFIHRMKHPSSKQISNSLTFDEIKAARIRWLQHAQAGFQQEIQLLRANKALGNQSQLVKISPIIDKDNLLRVGGRIQPLRLSAEAKHQQRPKWTTTTPNISIGSVALVKEFNTPPALWHLAKVIGSFQGKDNMVQAVRIIRLKTRPITKIAKLLSSETVFQDPELATKTVGFPLGLFRPWNYAPRSPIIST
ncbi:uncharacterized protein LOC123258307 [Drosophila ananassae]|uniref:uncharacterized protein LOC123258307 n=1 Tax=Drosophila ananassae TaxID=7217 RepID=UPI001CFFAB91|nr:uncharacterized protein LOC123258307 [Drosophila ananassae]